MIRILLPTLLFFTACPATKPRPRPANRPGRPLAAPRDPLQDALGRNLKQYRARLRRCHELAMAESYRVGGEVQVELLVRPMGVVTAVRKLRDTTGSELLVACLRHVTKNFVFPSADADRRLPVTLRFRRPKTKLTVRMGDVLAKAPLGRGVSAKVLITPRSVTGKRVSLTVLRLMPGAAVPPVKHRVPMGLHVLRGALKISGATRQTVMQTGESGVIAAGRAHGLAAAGTSMCAVLVFFLPAGPETLYLTGKLAAGSAWAGQAQPSADPLLLVRAFTSSRPGSIQLARMALPVPQVVTVPQGRTALLNPDGKSHHHALLVTAGAFWITIKGVKLPAEAGMALYLPGSLPAELAPLAGQAAELVVLPWPDKGSWSRSLTYRLLEMR
ncbi:MAG: cupin domain-containing protein [bacterium]